MVRAACVDTNAMAFQIGRQWCYFCVTEEYLIALSATIEAYYR